LGDGEGFIGFFFFFTGAFLVGVGVAFLVGVAVALAVADGVADGVAVAANPCAGIRERQSPKTSTVRFIDRSI
jgi:uncharacterized membrane protein YgaE (UPF0421/DUF939 family)